MATITRPASSEADRLKLVYREYAERGWGGTKWSDLNRGNAAIRREREQILQRRLRDAGYFPLKHRRILDVGCGVGETLGVFASWGAQPKNLYGVDLLADRICRARATHPDMQFQEANAETLPFADDFFDLVTVFTVFSSIQDENMARKVGGEINRVLRPAGAIVWYDIRRNNPRNPHVHGIGREKIARSFPQFNRRLRSVTLLPPLARRLGAWTDALYPWLASLPILRTHYLGLLKKL